jgi:hypothetical protein
MTLPALFLIPPIYRLLIASIAGEDSMVGVKEGALASFEVSLLVIDQESGTSNFLCGKDAAKRK